jgi:hypothetical protein
MRRRALRIAAALAAVTAAGCAKEAPPCAALKPGDLVITEVMASVSGADTGKEWFEVFNATGRPLDLAGLELWSSAATGSGAASHTMAGDRARFGDRAWLVLGGVAADAAPAWVDYPYGADLGSLRDSGGRLWLACEGTEIDAVTWEETDEGTSRQVSRDALSAAGNDAPAAWCDSTRAFPDGAAAGTELATPGAANDDCQAAPACTRPPVAGDLVITEVMADPEKPIEDDDGEWIEVLLTRTVDLQGVDFGTVNGDGSLKVHGSVASADCATTAAFTRVVFARSTDPLVNGGLPADARGGLKTLTNSGATVFVGYKGEVLDRATYAKAKAGTAWSLDPDAQTPEGNDDPAAWCLATAAYGADNLGTPGADNPDCP